MRTRLRIAVLMLVAIGSGTAVADPAVPKLDGSAPLDEFCEQVAQLREAGTASADLLVTAARANRIRGNVTEGIACGEAALILLKREPVQAGRAHLELALLLPARLEGAKAAEHAQAARKVLAKDDAEGHYAAIRAEGFGLRFEWEVREQSVKVWQEAIDLARQEHQAELAAGVAVAEQRWRLRLAEALTYRARIEVIIDGKTKDSDDRELIDQALALLNDEQWQKAERSAETRLVEAQIGLRVGAIYDRYHTKSNREAVPKEPEVVYAEAIKALVDLEKELPHRPGVVFARLDGVMLREKEIDDFLPTNQNGDQVEAYGEVIAKFDQLITLDPDNHLWRWEKGRAVSLCGSEHYEVKGYQQAAELWQQSIDVRRPVLQENGRLQQNRIYLMARLHGSKASALKRLGDPEEASSQYEKAVDLGDQALALDPTNLVVADWFSTTCGSLALLHRVDDPERAAKIYAREARVLETCIAALKKEPAIYTFQSQISDAYGQVALYLRKDDATKHQAAILEAHREALDHTAEAVSLSKSSTTAWRNRWKAYLGVTASLVQMTADVDADPATLHQARDLAIKAIEEAGAVQRQGGSVGQHAGEVVVAFQLLRTQINDVLAGRLPRGRVPMSDAP